MVDAATRTLRHVLPAGRDPEGVAVLQGGGTAIVSNEDLARAGDAGHGPGRLRDGRRAYVSGGRTGSVSVVDLVAHRLAATIDKVGRAALGHRALAGWPDALHGERAVR